MIIVVAPGCSSGIFGRSGDITYYDSNGNGAIDIAVYRFRGNDGSWAKIDSNHDGFFDTMIYDGFSPDRTIREAIPKKKPFIVGYPKTISFW